MKNILLAAVFMLFLVGCTDNSDNHPLLRKAAQSKRMGEYRNAEVCYKRYLAKNPGAAQIHLALAELYDEQLEEYLLAVYHYKEYLRLIPDKESRSAKNVRGFIERSERRYVNKGRNVKKVMLTDESEIERLTAAYKKRLAEEEKKLALELAELKKEAEKTKESAVSETVKADSAVAVTVAGTEKTSEKNIEDSAVENKVEVITSEKQSSDSAVANDTVEVKKAEEVKVEEKKETPPAVENEKKTEKKSAEVKSDLAEFPKMEDIKTDTSAVPVQKEIPEYKIQRGDTFTHLSRKFYGSIRYYRQLMEYNNISNPNSLRAGKTIKVPPLEILKGEK